MSTLQKITLLWGLPGSGKTTEAMKIAGIVRPQAMRLHQRSETACIIDMDRIGKRSKGDAFFKKVAAEVGDVRNSKHIILDGLITTNEAADKLLSAVLKQIDEKIDVVIVWWKKDVGACLHNDKGRRKIDSAATIKNLPFEEPSKELLKKYSAKSECRWVSLKPEFDIWMDERGFDKQSGYLESSRWSLGGTSCNYLGNTYQISPEQQPSFVEFDNLLLEICPELSFLKYKKLYNETVTIEHGSERDYYGGSTSYAYYQCNLKKLYELLMEWGYLGDSNGMEPQLPRDKA